jgi:hypothetical protein
MRLAYLITAYHQPSHLHRLVCALEAQGSEFFVHVDKRVSIEPFERPLRGRHNVHFAKTRFAVQWMGFSQVQSILHLLTEASAKGFDYCVLLSGSDYPIKSNDHIRSFYENTDEEFITFWRLEDRPSWGSKIQYYYPIEWVPIRGWSKDTEPVYWRRFFWGRFHQYRRWMPRRKFPFAMVPFGGSDWWSLSAGCVADLLRFVAANPAYVRFYRYTHCPSEMFFHTIVLNSGWRQKVRGFSEYEAWRKNTSEADKARESKMLPEDGFNLRYIDWSGTKTGERESPAVLDNRDWEQLLASPDLFARKFEVGASDGLLHKIDAEVLGRQSCASPI